MGSMMIDHVYTASLPVGAFFKIAESEAAPVGSQAMTDADTAAWGFLDECGGKTVDPTAPSLTAYASAENSGSGKPHCYNDDIAPHGQEGWLVYIGDLLTKEGKTDVAKTIYQGAKLSTTYDSWPYKSAIEGRLDGTAPYKAGEPYGVPNVGCGVCHASQ
jgi:hypothetical protein